MVIILTHLSLCACFLLLLPQFVLYSYSIFALMAGDEDYQDVMILIDRAKQAEITQDDLRRRRRQEPTPNPAIAKGVFPFGKCFELADAGFFRHHAMVSRNAFGWQSYALCRFLVFNDFIGSFGAYLEAFHFAPEDEKLMESFNMMMVHFHGKSKSKRDQVVKELMQHHAQIDADRQEQQRVTREAAMLRQSSAKKIQVSATVSYLLPISCRSCSVAACPHRLTQFDHSCIRTIACNAELVSEAEVESDIRKVHECGTREHPAQDEPARPVPEANPQSGRQPRRQPPREPCQQ